VNLSFTLYCFKAEELTAEQQQHRQSFSRHLHTIMSTIADRVVTMMDAACDMQAIEYIKTALPPAMTESLLLFSFIFCEINIHVSFSICSRTRMQCIHTTY
jgi:hypothetical protein